ncbi:MAG: hypothetical protein ACI841_004045, partial [Planctomycetota bacterium]
RLLARWRMQRIAAFEIANYWSCPEPGQLSL